MAQMLPKIVQSASGKSYDSSSPQGKMIVNSPNYKNPFDKQSSALAPMDPSGSGLAASGAASSMSPMESAMAIFQSMADSLESIKESAISLVAAAGPSRADALEASNVEGDPDYVPPVDPEDAGGGGEGKPSRIPSLKKIGLTLLIAGVMLFAEKLKPVLAKVLEGFKFVYNILKTSFLAVFDYVSEFFADPVGTLKKSLDAVLDGLASLGAWIWDKAIKPVWDWISGLFDSGAGLFIKEKFQAVAGVYVAIGTWIWEKAIKPIWDWISGLFGFGKDDETAVEGEEKGWTIVSVISGVFTSIKEWFGKLFKFDSTSNIITSLVNVITFVPNLLKDLITGATEWLLGLFGFDDAAKKLANATDWTFGSLITGAFKAVKDWFVGLFTWGKETGTTEAGDWSLFKFITGVWTNVKTWFTTLFSWASEEKEGDSWLVGTVKKVVTSVKEWFKKLFSFDSKSDAITSLINVITFVPNMLKDLITGATEWLLGLFGFDDAAKKVANATDWTFGSLISGAFIAVKDWFAGIFSWGESEESDTDKEKFSLFQLVKDAAAGMFAYLKGLFTFSPDTMKGMKEGFSNIGTFISAIKAGALGAIKSPFSPVDGFMAAFDAKLAEGGLMRKSQMGQTIPSDTTTMGGNASTLANESAMLDASGGGVTIIGGTNNSTTSTTSDTYNQQELSSDDKESSGSWWSRVDLTPWN